MHWHGVRNPTSFSHVPQQMSGFSSRAEHIHRHRPSASCFHTRFNSSTWDSEPDLLQRLTLPLPPGEGSRVRVTVEYARSVMYCGMLNNCCKDNRRNCLCNYAGPYFPGLHDPLLPSHCRPDTVAFCSRQGFSGDMWQNVDICIKM